MLNIDKNKNICRKKAPEPLAFGIHNSAFRISPRGFGLIEAVVGAALISIFLAGVTSVATFSSRLLSGAALRTGATFLLEEGVDAARGLRDASWTSNIAPLSLDTDYWLQFNGGAWTLTALPQPFIDGRFDRRVRVSQVLRDSSDDITSGGGTADVNTKKITISVSWSERGATTTESVSAYIMNIFNN